MEAAVFAANEELLKKFDNLERIGSPKNRQTLYPDDHTATTEYLRRQLAIFKEQLAHSEERLSLEKSNSTFLRGQLQTAKIQLKRTTKLVTDMQTASAYPPEDNIVPAILLLTNTSDVSAALTILRSWKEVYSQAHGLHAILTSALNLNN